MKKGFIFAYKDQERESVRPATKSDFAPFSVNRGFVERQRVLAVTFEASCPLVNTAWERRGKRHRHPSPYVFSAKLGVARKKLVKGGRDFWPYCQFWRAVDFLPC